VCQVGSHELNQESSRSHSLLTVYVESTHADIGDTHAHSEKRHVCTHTHTHTYTQPSI